MLRWLRTDQKSKVYCRDPMLGSHQVSRKVGLFLALANLLVVRTTATSAGLRDPNSSCARFVSTPICLFTRSTDNAKPAGDEVGLAALIAGGVKVQAVEARLQLASLACKYVCRLEYTCGQACAAHPGHRTKQRSSGSCWTSLIQPKR